LDAVLQGIDIMHYNALNISQGVNDVHKKIIINLNMVEKNQSKLNDAQKMLDQVNPHARKPSCICNVVLCNIFINYSFPSGFSCIFNDKIICVPGLTR
jgi:hypothetical protein